MAGDARPFYVLVTLFAFIQIVVQLWPKHHSHHHPQQLGMTAAHGGGLVSYLFKRADPDPDLLGIQCEDVWGHDDQCTFVEEFCSDYSTGMFNYLHFYFCDLNSQHALALVIMALWMIFLFALVGVTASDFFCPNLNTIAKTLHLSESMTGVTFLAFGNASPDIFSTFSAIGAGSGTLAIGEVVGAASFITSIVIGSMAVIKPFKVSKAPFLRDTLFFTGCVLFTLYMVLSKKITFWQSIVLIIAYVTYVAIVVFGNWKQRGAVIAQGQLLSPATATGADSGAELSQVNAQVLERGDVSLFATASVRHADDTSSLSIQNSESTALQKSLNMAGASSEPGTQMMPLSSPPSRALKNSILSPIDPSYRPRSSSSKCPDIVVDSLIQSPSLSPSSPPTLRLNNTNLMLPEKRGGYTAVSDDDSPNGHRLHYYRHRRLSSQSLDGYDENDPSRDPSLTQFQQALMSHSLILPDRSNPINQPRSPIFAERSFQDSIPVPVVSFPQKCKMVLTDWVMPAYFPTLLEWNEKSYVLKLLALGSIPIVLMLTLTLPVVELAEDQNRTVSQPREQDAPVAPESTSEASIQHSEHWETRYDGWCRIATMIQMVIAPVFITWVVTTAARGPHLAVLAAFGAGIALSTAIFCGSTWEKPPRFYEGLAFVGFLVAMTWIFLVASEVVGILQAFGMILGVSDAILGLTVFAMGNSLGDLVANITIAKMGFPRMAFSACFGGPLLNMLLGVGISGTYVTLSTGADIPLEISPTLLVSLGGVLVTMGGALVAVPRSGYMLCRWWGFFLLAVYVVCMVTNVVLEVRRTRQGP
ncbi:hypothetical protein EDD11_003215 [Mortierella claussenii]|nr:hypothetical protein EDD11_003215 [Mortierella claussenii]